jgi:hypothetical protein
MNGEPIPLRCARLAALSALARELLGVSARPARLEAVRAALLALVMGEGVAAVAAPREAALIGAASGCPRSPAEVGELSAAGYPAR